MAGKVHQEWDTLTSDLPENVRDTWWSTIEQKYGGMSNRSYHDMAHLASKFTSLAKCSDKLSNPRAVGFALFFHYLEYNPKSADNEAKSVAQFRSFCEAALIAEDSPLSQEVCELIEQASTHITDAHKSEGSFGCEDKHYFLDLDMVVLGSPPDEYDIYSEKIRAEYAFLPDEMYRGLRTKVLQSFLLIPNIFSTREFRDEYENQARENITREIQKLK